jgi:hypothetical protein
MMAIIEEDENSHTSRRRVVQSSEAIFFLENILIKEYYTLILQ